MPESHDGRFIRRHEAHFGDRLIRCFAHRPRSIMAMLDATIEMAGEADALIFEGERLDYRQLGYQADRVAANLSARGVRAGDRVALLPGNGFEFVLSLLGVLRLGAIVVPLNIREQRHGLSFILESCSASALIFDVELADKRPDEDAVPSLRHQFVVGGDADGAEPFDALLSDDVPEIPPVAVDEEDTAVILYTSGTTGQPKGAMLTHLNIIHSVMHFEHAMAFGQGERAILTVPASHVTGLVANLLTMVRVAGCSIIMRAFDAEAFIRLAAAERATYSIMVPAMYNLCLLRADFESLDLSAWRIGGFGGAPMPEATIARFREKLPNLQLANAYGSTETTSPTTIMPPEFTAVHPDSVGRPLACADVRIMDDDGREVAAGESGELWISGPMVVRGYWNNAEATAENFFAGYWRSGDIGAIDADGFVRILDRKKDMIIRGGYNIYSAELENLLYDCPGVAECAVVAQPDPVLGEKIHVFICYSDPALSEAQIKNFCAERLADYKTPDFVTLQEAVLPRNANGKVIKRDLRDQAASMSRT